MWTQATWMVVGAAAMLFTFISLFGRRTNVIALFVGSSAAFLLWLVWAINAFAVESITNAGVGVVHNYPALGYVGYVFALLMVADLFMAILQAAGIDLGGFVSNAT